MPSNSDNMNITKKHRNALLKRHEISAVLLEKANPGSAQARSMLAAELKVAEELIALKKLRNTFGSNEFQIEAFVYDSLADLQRIEPQAKAAMKKEGQ